MASADQECKETKTVKELPKLETHDNNSRVTGTPSLEVVLPTAFVVKNLLNLEEQLELYSAIESTSKLSGQYKPYNKINKNKKYQRILDINIDSTDVREKAKHGKLDIFDKYIKKALTFILKHKNSNIDSDSSNSNSSQETSDDHKSENDCSDSNTSIDIAMINRDGYTDSKEFTYNYIKAQEYFVPNGYIFDHCDNVKGWVILFSIGCTPKFYVSNKTLISKDNPKGEKLIDFQSGNVLIFDSSRTAGIFHRIDGVNADSCPIQLGEKFPRLQTTRVGLQVRTRGYSSVKNKLKFSDN